MNLQKRSPIPFIVAVLTTAISGIYTHTYAQSTASASISPKPIDSDSLSGQDTPQPPIDVNIFIRVPHNYKPVDVFTAFPYPVKPPPISSPYTPLSTKRKEIEQGLLNSGYANRSSDSTTWSGTGWRWRYAVEAAVNKSGLSYPHTIFDMYSWTHEMAPYMLPFILRINAAEEQRSKRYDQATDFYENNGLDLENEATRNSYSAVPLAIAHNQCRVKLTPGNWWITGRHKITGLVYYWQVPITVKAGQPVNMTLTEWNALLIQGVW